MAASSNKNPIFTRGQVADILGITASTIANREKSGTYPEPIRDVNNYRRYKLRDVLHLQLVTFDQLDPVPIISVMYDMGYDNPKIVSEIIERGLSEYKGDS